MKFLRSLVDVVAEWTSLSKEGLGRFAGLIEARLRALENTKADLDAAVTALNGVALSRINEVLTPAIQQVLKIQEKGYLIARSTSPATLGLNNIVTLVIDDEDERALFTPSPYPALTRAEDSSVLAVTRLVDYTAETGELLLEVVAFWGTPGPHDDWVITATAGVAQAQREMLVSAEAARDKSKSWAEANNGVEVEAGQFSAKHHKNAAATSAGQASTSAGNAATSATGANSAATLAANFADEDEDTPVAPGQYSAKHWAKKAEAFAIAAAAFDPDDFVSNAEMTSAIAAALATMVGAAPALLNDMAEIAAAINNDPNFFASVTAQLALKFDKAGGTITGDTKFAGGVKQSVTALGNGSGARALDSSASGYYTATSTGISTWSITGQPAAGEIRTVMLELTNGGAAAQTFTGVKWNGGIAPALTAVGTDRLIFTIDGAGNKIGNIIGKAIA